MSTFTVEEDPQPVGNITGKINHVNLTSLPGATVSLYQDGAPYDMNFIGQHFGQSTSQPYPVYNVNGDGAVNASDLDIVIQYL